MTTNHAQIEKRQAARSEPRELDLLPRIEAALAEPLLEGMPIGPVLTDAVVNELINQTVTWGLRQRWRDRLRWLHLRLRARRPRPGLRDFPPDRLLVTWRGSTPRIDDQVRPVLEELGPSDCCVIYQRPEVLSAAPPGVFAISWREAVPHDPAGWNAAFGRGWPHWKAGLRRFCRDTCMPRGVYEHMAAHLLELSMLLRGSLEFLRRCRPRAIVTDYDRSVLWSCLVLAARQLQIPTFSILHGVLAPLPKAFRYGLADFQFCWGEFDRQNFLQAGEDPARLIIAGCPRLTRDVALDAPAIRRRLGLDPQRPVVLLGTSPVPLAERLHIGEIFCRGMEILPRTTGVVRLHPSEGLSVYADLIARHPTVHFVDNRQATLDEAMAVADVVVVQNSGLGGDALVKRRLTVVIDSLLSSLGYGRELVEEAGCPCITTPEELATALKAMLFDERQRESYRVAAERYVGRFCAYFGRESARQIARTVHGIAVRGRPLQSKEQPLAIRGEERG